MSLPVAPEGLARVAAGEGLQEAPPSPSMPIPAALLQPSLQPILLVPQGPPGTTVHPRFWDSGATNFFLLRMSPAAFALRPPPSTLLLLCPKGGASQDFFLWALQDLNSPCELPGVFQYQA